LPSMTLRDPKRNVRPQPHTLNWLPYDVQVKCSVIPSTISLPHILLLHYLVWEHLLLLVHYSITAILRESRFLHSFMTRV
jgi:hypothetical protein